MMGILPYVAADLNIGIPVAGHFISAYALGVCAGAPMLILARKRPLKHILLALMALMLVGNLGAAMATGYWSLLALVPAPDAPAGADVYSMEGTIVGYIDRLLLPGKLHNKIFDPEGLLSTVPAVATAMLGMLTGEFVRLSEQRLSGNRKALYIALAAVAFTLVGILWDLSFPINKKLWTSSFVCVVAGYSLGMFALFYWIIDVKGYKGWVLPFQVIGLNSITIYMAQRIVDFKGISAFFFGGLAAKMPEALAPVVASTGYLLVSWLFLYFLYKKRIFLKV